MTIGLIAYAGSVLARHEAFGQGVALLALVAVSFWLASLGRLEAFAMEVASTRRAKKSSGSAGGASGSVGSAATTSVVRRLLVISCALALAYWVSLTFLL